MEMLGNWKPTLPNLKDAFEAAVSSSESAPALRAFNFVVGLPLFSYLKRPNKVPPPQKNCHHNPKGSIGILSAIIDPAAADLRIVEPFHGTCKFCHHSISNGPIYVYKGEMGFCKPECRYECILEANERQRRLAIAAAQARARLTWAKPKRGVEFFVLHRDRLI